MTSQFESVLEKLSDERLTALRRDDLAVMNLADAIPPLEAIRRDLRAADLATPEDLPSNQVATAVQAVSNQLPQLLTQMEQWNPAGDGNSTSARNSFIQQARDIRNTVAIHLRPYVRPDFSSAAETAQRLSGIEKRHEELIANATHTIQEATATVDELRTQAVKTAASRVSGYYKTAEKSHRDTARNYLIAAGLLSTILIFAVLLIFRQSTNSAPGTDVAGAIKDLAARILVLLVLTAAVAFSARNYRINKHLEVLNHTRYNALETFQLFISGVTEDARNIVVSELVRAVFNPGDTGYMNTDREQMIVDNPGSALAFLSNSGRPG